MEPAMSQQSQDEGRMQSLDQALNTLNEAAANSAAEIRQMIQQDYAQLRGIFSDARPHLREALDGITHSFGERFSTARDQVTTRGRDTARELDRRIHEDPWTYVAASAGIAAVIGYLLARRARS